jgi:hypothetical protein
MGATLRELIGQSKTKKKKEKDFRRKKRGKLKKWTHFFPL